jgi:hypothetical protein
VVVLPLQSVNGAVQLTPPGQQAWPFLPQVPPPQPPLEQAAPTEQLFPGATQVGFPVAF